MLNQQPSLDLTFQALADPTRRAMVERLTQGPATVSELAQPLPMSLPAVMQHLAMLESAGLVRSRKVGRVRTCQIDIQVLRETERWLNQARIAWDNRMDRLGAFLQAIQTPESKDDTHT